MEEHPKVQMPPAHPSTWPNHSFCLLHFYHTPTPQRLGKMSMSYMPLLRYLCLTAIPSLEKREPSVHLTRTSSWTYTKKEKLLCSEDWFVWFYLSRWYQQVHLISYILLFTYNITTKHAIFNFFFNGGLFRSSWHRKLRDKDELFPNLWKESDM